MLTLNALWVAACPDETGNFLSWIVGAVGTSMQRETGLQIMYGIGGEHDLSERVTAYANDVGLLSEEVNPGPAN